MSSLPSPPPSRVRAFFFVAQRVHSAFPTLVDFHLFLLLTHARALSARESFFAQEKVPMNIHEYALDGGARTGEIDLRQKLLFVSVWV